jgi:hypothetical protein
MRDDFIKNILFTKLNNLLMYNKIKFICRNLYDFLFIIIGRLPIGLTIKIKSKKCGFFGDFAQTLNAIRFSEINSFNCKVDWDHRSLYYDVNFGQNVWEYYFNKSEYIFTKKKSAAYFMR